MGLGWLRLAVCALAIGYAGARLTRPADAIGGKSGMSGASIGLLLLLAAVTSPPELATGINAVTFADAPEIALGDVLGGTGFNLMLRVVLDVLHRPEAICRGASSGHILSAGWAIAMWRVGGAGVLLEREQIVPRLGSVGACTPVLVVLHGLAMRSVFAYGSRRKRAEPPAAQERHAGLGLRSATLQCAALAGVVTPAGIWLPVVGTLLVAGATSLPEVVMMLAALRLRAPAMAIGGLLGSNLFDLLVVAVDHAFYGRGAILAAVSPVHAVTALSAVMMSGAVILGLVQRPRRRHLRTMTVVSVGLLVVYLINVHVLFVHRG